MSASLLGFKPNRKRLRLVGQMLVFPSKIDKIDAVDPKFLDDLIFHYELVSLFRANCDFPQF